MGLATTGHKDEEQGGDSHRKGDVGVFQALGLGLMVFTILMAILGVVLSLFVDFSG